MPLAGTAAVLEAHLGSGQAAAGSIEETAGAGSHWGCAPHHLLLLRLQGPPQGRSGDAGTAALLPEHHHIRLSTTVEIMRYENTFASTAGK